MRCHYSITPTNEHISIIFSGLFNYFKHFKQFSVNSLWTRRERFLLFNPFGVILSTNILSNQSKWGQITNRYECHHVVGRDVGIGDLGQNKHVPIICANGKKFESLVPSAQATCFKNAPSYDAICVVDREAIGQHWPIISRRGSNQKYYLSQRTPADQSNGEYAEYKRDADAEE